MPHVKANRKLISRTGNIQRVKEALEIVHGDLCGPISPPTMSGNKYFFLLVDDHTRAMWVYFLKNKDEALEAFKQFKEKIENGTARKIRAL